MSARLISWPAPRCVLALIGPLVRPRADPPMGTARRTPPCESKVPCACEDWYWCMRSLVSACEVDIAVGIAECKGMCGTSRLRATLPARFPSTIAFQVVASAPSTDTHSAPAPTVAIREPRTSCHNADASGTCAAIPDGVYWPGRWRVKYVEAIRPPAPRFAPDGSSAIQYALRIACNNQHQVVSVPHRRLDRLCARQTEIPAVVAN